MRPRTADWDIHLWAAEFLLWSAPALRHTGMQIVLCAFTDFPRVLVTFPNSIHGPSDSLFPFFSAPRDVRANFLHRWLYFHLRHGSVAALAADILPLFSWSRSHHSLSQIVPFHITFFLSSPSATSASKTNGDSELSMLFAHPRHKKSFPTEFTLCDGKKAGKNLVLCGLKPTVAEADLLWTFQLQAKRGKSAGHTYNTGMYTCAYTFTHTAGLPSNWYAPSFTLFLHVGYVLVREPIFFPLTFS